MTTTIRMPEELHKALKERARQQGMTFNSYLMMILWIHIRK